MMKKLPKKGLVMLTYIFNAVLRISYWLKQLETAEIILIPKPGKDPKELTSYRPIILLSTVNRIFEKLLLWRINADLKPDYWMPPHQFGFRNQHSTVQQTHRIIHTIHQALEDKQYCTSIFLDISQAFDKVWQAGLLFKVKKLFPLQYFRLLKSYLAVNSKQELTGKYPVNTPFNLESHKGACYYTCSIQQISQRVFTLQQGPLQMTQSFLPAMMIQ
jgi:hypothetical protein